LVHVSDLHFGRADARLETPLIDAIADAAPDLVAVTGDLTQRARDHQFARARAFLDRLSAPWICVPGNHDMPLDRPFARLVRPFSGYRRHITANLAPHRVLPGLNVQALNTADPFAWQRGRVRRRQLRAACAAFPGTPGLRVVLAHHPFQHSPETGKTLMKGAGPALDALADCGADVILSGHLHRWRAEPFLSRRGAGRLMQVHIGTGLSTRLRGEENDFAILDTEAESCRVTRMVARQGAFEAERIIRFDTARAPQQNGAET
jgi:3',5'-cyclic AMP phosphodiesterase CpdA